MRIERINDIYEALKSNATKKRLIVAYANDSHSIEAVHMAVEKGIVEGVLVGDECEIGKICKEHGYNLANFKVVHEPEEQSAALKAVELVRNGEGDALMKGLVSTDKYMRAILNKENGLAVQNSVLTHVTVMQSNNYHKLLIVSDVAIIPLPDLDQKKAIIKYVTGVAQKMGVEKPKVALVTATEQVLPKVQSTVEAAILAKMAERGQICPGAIVEGPLALDVAIDKEAAEIKKICSEVAGDADCLVFPNLEAGNVFYKTNTKMCNTRLGAILMGAKVPCVLSSRGDNVDTKLNSIALAALMA